MAVRMADVPENDRPRERLARVGLGGLADAELLALVVGSGGPGRSALDVGRLLLAEHGSIASLSEARPEELSRIGSMGAAKAAAVAAAFELGRRAGHACALPIRVAGPEDLVRAVVPHMADIRREEVFVVALTAGNRLVRVTLLSSGGSDHATAPVRDVIATVLRLSAAAFGLAHTHPSGDPTPGPEDVRISRRLADAAATTGLRFVDHVVIAGRRWASLRRLGYLE